MNWSMPASHTTSCPQTTRCRLGLCEFFGPLTTTAATYGLYRVATVNRESLVRVDGNQYSVPAGHGGQAVDVRVFRDGVRLSRDGAPLAAHARLEGTGHRRRDPAHYAAVLDGRPRARL